MKSCFLILILCLSKLLYSQDNQNVNYSVLIEEDGNAALFIIQSKNGDSWGSIIQFGGFAWFEKTFDTEKNLLHAIIPSDEISDRSKIDSYIKEKYFINDFRYNFQKEEDGDQLIIFESPQALHSIRNYIAQDKEFSFFAANEDAWSAGSFTTIKSIDDLKKLSKSNPVSFCKLIKVSLTHNTPNREMNINSLYSTLEKDGITCDKFNNVIDDSKTISPPIENNINSKTNDNNLEKIDYCDLVYRDNLYYKKFSEKPFTGEVTGAMSSMMIDGKSEGLQITYYDTGQIAQKVFIKNGKLRGEAPFYYKSGKVFMYRFFNDNGKIEGKLTTYLENGDPQSVIEYDNGERKESYDYFQNGNLQTKRVYSNGGKEIFEIEYWKNGSIFSKGMIIDIYREGLYDYYNEYGNQIAKITYKKNNIVNSVFFQENLYCEKFDVNNIDCISKFYEVEAKKDKEDFNISFPRLNSCQ